MFVGLLVTWNWQPPHTALARWRSLASASPYHGDPHALRLVTQRISPFRTALYMNLEPHKNGAAPQNLSPAAALGSHVVDRSERSAKCPTLPIAKFLPTFAKLSTSRCQRSCIGTEEIRNLA